MVVTAALFGLGIGVALGMLGGGGSVLAVPVLVYVLDQDVHSATTASLIVVAVAAVAGAAGHGGVGRICWRHAAAFSVPAVGGILVGTALNTAVDGDLLLLLFAPVMVAAALATWRKAGGPEGPEPAAGAQPACPPLLLGRDAAAGLAVGVLTGFFGVGGGFVVVPALAIAIGLPLRSAIGTSLVIVAVVSLVGLGAHLGAGNSVDAGIAAAMTAATAAGAVVGARVAPRVSQEALGRAFAGLVMAVAAYLVVAGAFLGGAPNG